MRKIAHLTFGGHSGHFGIAPVSILPPIPTI
jgi:hypothetical protein